MPKVSSLFFCTYYFQPNGVIILIKKQKKKLNQSKIHPSLLSTRNFSHFYCFYITYPRHQLLLTLYKDIKYSRAKYKIDLENSQTWTSHVPIVIAEYTKCSCQIEIITNKWTGVRKNARPHRYVMRNIVPCVRGQYQLSYLKWNPLYVIYFLDSNLNSVITNFTVWFDLTSLLWIFTEYLFILSGTPSLNYSENLAV